MSARTLLVTAAVLVLAVAGVAALLQPRPGEGQRPVEQVVEAGAPGVLVHVRDRGKTRTVVLGVAHDAPRRLVHAGDRFRVGSVTKTFVATVVLQLVAEGRIELDDTVDQWLPGLVPGGEEITIRQLLAHMSGLFDYVEDERVFAPYEQDPRHAWSPRALVELALAHPSPLRPGERYAYSSTNYLLLQLIVERVSGTSLEHQLETRIVEPLGLEGTSFEPGVISGAHIHGHRPPSHQGIVTGPPRDTSAEAASWTWGAAAIVSTADDLRRFFHALLRGRLLAAGQLRDMETLVPAGSLRYGLGLAVFPTPCGDAWGHTGNAQGTITVAWNTRDASRQVVVVVNAYPLTGELEDAVRRLQLSAFCGMDD
ncbi:MAG TPA: serine hydrolase domain-containing protein [Gaiellaceae bacterium]|nr:serine hydrolase domain-containing protein [Gaiellaceae bacterium]